MHWKTDLGILALVISTVFLVLPPAFAEPSIPEPTSAELSIPEPTSCVDVESWVEGHSDALPRSFEEFASVPAGYQAGVFNALTAAERNDLWTAHLDQYRESHPELDAGERRALREMADLFRGGKDTPSGDGSDALAKHLIATFQARLLGLVLDKLDRESVEQLSQIPDCDCRRGIDPNCVAAFCIPNHTCCTGDNVCSGLFE